MRSKRTTSKSKGKTTRGVEGIKEACSSSSAEKDVIVKDVIVEN